MFKKNTSVTGFPIGHFIQTADGAAKTTGTPTCKRLLDGVGGTLTNAAAYDATAGVWKIDLAAADTDGDMVGLVFSLADCIPISYAIRTSTSLVSDVETDTADIQTRLPAALIGGRIDASVGAMATDVLTEDAVNGNASEKIAGAVRAELATELARIDIAISDAWDEVREDHTTEGSFGALSEYIPSSTATASAVRIELATELAHLDADVSDAISLTPQETRDAMKLAPTAGSPAAGSVDAELDAILLITDTLDTSAVTVTTSNDAGKLTFYRGVTFAATVSGLTISSSWSKIVFTIKSDLDLADTAAAIQIIETNPGVGTDGLLYLNAATVTTPITAADGALTVSQAGGTVAIALSDDATALLSRARGLHWDIKQWVSSATTLLASGSADIELTPTRTV